MLINRCQGSDVFLLSGPKSLKKVSSATSMEDHPLTRLSLLANWPEIPKKQRTPREIVVEMESPTVESALDLVTSDESQSLDSNRKTKKRRRSTKKTKKRKPLRKPPILKLHAMPDVLRRKIEGMGGGRIILVLQKQLSYTDVCDVNSRLSIPRGQLIFEFLSKEEETSLDGHKDNSKRKAGIHALVIDPRLEEKELVFKKWEMESACVFNLIQNWNELVLENGLEAGDTIQLWSFRNKQRRAASGSDLCFALVKLEEGEGNNDDGAAEDDGAGSE